MQDFARFDFVITIPELIEANRTCKNVMVMINGEYYLIKDDGNYIKQEVNKNE